MSRGKTTSKPYSGWGSFWGEYDSTAQLPNVSGATEQDTNLNVGDTACVGTEIYVCTVGAVGGAEWKTIARDGGTGKTRAFVGPFTAPGAAGVTAASQTNLDCRYSHIAAAAATSFVATRAGSIVGISAQLSAAITGAGTTIVASVTKNGTEVACTCTLTQAGAEVAASGTATAGTLTFAAGDVIGVSYTSTGISNTPTLVCTIEIES